MGFATVVEVSIRTEMADQAVIQRKMAASLSSQSFKRPVKEL